MENAYVPARALQHSSTKEPDYKYCPALVGLFFLLHTSPLIAHKLLRKLYKGKPLVLEGSISLKETLQQLVKEHARRAWIEESMDNQYFKNMFEDLSSNPNRIFFVECPEVDDEDEELLACCCCCCNNNSL